MEAQKTNLDKTDADDQPSGSAVAPKTRIMFAPDLS
jgi:hypothetical protein